MLKKISVLLVGLSLSSCATSPSILTNESKLTHEDARKLGIILSTDNVPALKEIFAKLPANRDEWSLSDSGLVSQAFALSIIKGRKCNADVMAYLRTLTPGIEWEYIRNSQPKAGIEARYEDAAFCGSHLKDFYEYTITQGKYSLEDPKYKSSRIESFIGGNSNALVNYINRGNVQEWTTADFESFRVLIQASIPFGREACTTSASSEGCLALQLYKKTGGDMKEMKVPKNAPFAKKWTELQQLLTSI